MIERVLAPADERLSPVRVFLHADWLAHLVSWPADRRRRRRAGRLGAGGAKHPARPAGVGESSLAVLSAIVVAAPFFALARAVARGGVQAALHRRR